MSLDGKTKRRLNRRINTLKRRLSTDAAANRNPVNAERRQELWYRLARISNTLEQLDGCNLLDFEIEQMRPLVEAIRDFEHRYHIALARPRWSPGPQTRSPSFIYFSGPVQMRRHLSLAAEACGATVSALDYPGAEPSEARFRDLRAASVAAFDLTTKDPQVFYDLGIALALGTELLLLAQQGTDLPFDVAQTVVEYPTEGACGPALVCAVADALYQISPGAGELGDVFAQVSMLAPGPLTATAAMILDEARVASNDPLMLRVMLQNLPLAMTDTRLGVLQPRWPVPPTQPAREKPTCFVVMPFRDELLPTHKAIAERCEQANLLALRGDEPANQDIIERIWTEVVRADRVVVDLTGLNPNVCLELGIAHTLGRPTFLLGRTGTERALFSSIAKLECHSYQPPLSPASDQNASTINALNKFLA